jgi:hypothetical protein
MAFKRFDPEDFVISSDAITSTLWSTNSPTLTSFNTSSTQEVGSTGDFYLSVYQTSSNLSTAEVQFDIVYADVLGSGSALYNSLVPENSPTKTMYGQYRSLILEDETAQFIFGTGTNVVTGSNFWVLSIERAQYKQQLFPGSLNLRISGSNGRIINLTDNSVDTSVNQFIGSTQVYQLISGSNGTAGSLPNSGYVAGSGSYGLVFPELGTIILNPFALSQSLNLFPSRSNNVEGFNNRRLFNAISGAGSFALNSQETITSDYVFVRARNSEFNYSENPSFISGSTGEVIYSNFINAPQVYITTVGMYNDSNDLLAVAKMSRPLLKDFTKEALIRVKLDF